MLDVSESECVKYTIKIVGFLSSKNIKREFSPNHYRPLY